MNRTEQHAQGPSQASAARAALLAALLLAVLLLSASATASADTSIGKTGFPASFGPGGLRGASGLAVSNSEGGDIYAADKPSSRVSEFHSNGDFVRSFGWGVVPAAAAATGTLAAESSSITNVITTSGAFVIGQTITGSGIPANTVITAVNSNSLTLSKPATASGAAVPLSVAAGPGNVPVNEQQTVTIGGAPSGGTFTLTFASPQPSAASATTTAIPFDATAAEVQSKLASLATVGAGNVEVSGTAGGPWTVEFSGSRYADTNVSALTAGAAGLTPSGTVTVSSLRQGAASLETCTVICWSGEEGPGPGEIGRGHALAIDNDPGSESYGDVYVVDQRNYRIEKYDPEGHFLLMFGGEVDKTTDADLCTAADLAAGDTCGAGVPGTGPSQFYDPEPASHKYWDNDPNSSIAVGADGTVYVGDRGRIEEFNPDGTFAGEFALPGEASVLGMGSLAKESATVSSVTTASGSFAVGQPISGSGIPRSTNIVAVGSGTLTLSKPATVSAAGVALTVEPQFITALALDSAGNLFERSSTYGSLGGPIQTQIPGVREYQAAPSHSLLRTFDAGAEEGGAGINIALDSGGDLFVAANTTGNAQFRAFKPSGTLYEVFTSAQLPDGTNGIAIDDGAGYLYGSDTESSGGTIISVPLPTSGPPTVTEQHLSDLEPTTTTLHGFVNPRGFDTEYHFEYVDQESFEHEGGFSSPHTVSTPESDLGLVNQADPVQAAISGLAPGTTYHFHIVATSHCNEAEPLELCKTPGADQTFTTLPPVSVRDFATQTVGPELVTLKAELNPNGSATHYTIRYGTGVGYSCEPGNSCSVEGDLPIGNQFVKLEAEGREGVTFAGLRPNTTYHYRLTATNTYGDVEAADAIFTTEPSAAEERAAENCPNTILREENDSLDLPDCRAYEQVTPPDKQGGAADGQPLLAPGGERVYFSSAGSFAGTALNPSQSSYISSRTPGGWVSQGIPARIAPLGTEPYLSNFFAPELDRWLYGEVPVLDYGQEYEQLAGEPDPKGIYYSLGFADAPSILHATPTLTYLEGSHQGRGNLLGLPYDLTTSDDLSRIFLPTPVRLDPSDARPDDPGGGFTTRIYEIAGIGGPSPTLVLAAELPLGLEPGGGTTTPCALDDALIVQDFGLALSRLNSSDGSALFYTSPVERQAGAPCGEGTPNPIGIFARVDGGSPFQLNVPPPGQCSSPSPCATSAPATPRFDTASPDGSRVWFTTSQPLIDSDTDATNDLYLAKLAGGHLVELIQVSAGDATATHPTPGQGADVGEEGVASNESTFGTKNDGNNSGVLDVSADGSHAAFVSGAVLTANENALDQSAVKGANNLYVYDAASGQTRFVTELCSGPEQSGTEDSESTLHKPHFLTSANAVADLSCPASLSGFVEPASPRGYQNDDQLWMPGQHSASFTPGGRYLTFLSYGRLTPDDTDNLADLYRYDFQTGQLIRLSFGRNGNDANGNDDSYPVSIPEGIGHMPSDVEEDAARSISADGSRVIFTTVAPLVSSDTNDAPDLYQWEEQGHGTCAHSEDGSGGCLRIVSDGLDPHGIRGGLISSSGRDVTFRDYRGLVPGDTDGVPDLYDAREEGGFPPAPPRRPCGSTDTCHEANAQMPVPPQIATEEDVHGLEEPGKLRCAKGKHREKRHGQVRCVPDSHHMRRHHKATHNRAHANRRAGK